MSNHKYPVFVDLVDTIFFLENNLVQIPYILQYIY